MSGTNKTPERIRAAILAADRSIPSKDLAEKYGVSYATVWLIRRDAGIKVVRATGGKPVAKRNPKVAPAAAIVHSKPVPAAAIAVSDCKVAITGEITPAGADKFWSILSMEQKRQIILASIHSILNTAQEA